jgi:hypothetical protein
MNKEVEKFDEVIHNSEVFNVLDKPHVVEDSFKTAMTKSQVVEYVNAMKTPTAEELEQSYVKQHAAPEFSGEAENYKK